MVIIVAAFFKLMFFSYGVLFELMPRLVSIPMFSFIFRFLQAVLKFPFPCKTQSFSFSGNFNLIEQLNSPICPRLFGVTQEHLRFIIYSFMLLNQFTS